MAGWWTALDPLFYFCAAGCLIAYMLADRRATADELLAAGGARRQPIRFLISRWSLSG
jgi:hypothetical protein